MIIGLLTKYAILNFLDSLLTEKTLIVENIRKIVHDILALLNKNQSEGWFMEGNDLKIVG